MTGLTRNAEAHGHRGHYYQLTDGTYFDRRFGDYSGDWHIAVFRPASEGDRAAQVIAYFTAPTEQNAHDKAKRFIDEEIGVSTQ